MPGGLSGGALAVLELTGTLVLHIWQGYLTISYYFIFDRIVCVLPWNSGDFLPMRTLCDKG